jgi:tetratricopeptide (TPR) repeat protein
MRPTGWRFWSALFAAMIVLSYSAAADQCDTPQAPEATIIACTQSINSGTWKGRDLAAYYNNRGYAYSHKGDLDRAIADYSEAIRIDPVDADAFTSRGVAYRAKGDNDRAIADFNEAIRLDPKDAVAFNNRGYAYSAKGDLDRAIADYSEAIRLDPKHGIAFNNRGIAYLKKGDNGSAIVDYSEAIRINPEDADAFNSRAVAYRAKGDLDRAIADYNEAIRLDPKSGEAFVSRGSAYSAKGDLDRAIADYNEAIRLNPKSSLGYFARGRSYLFAGSVEKALADFNQASAHALENAYLALWVDIASRRNKLPSRLAQTSSQIDMTVWPAPVIRLFMDQMTPAAVLAAADDPNATKKKGQVCDANFYSGELSLTKGLKDEATRFFRLAASDCPRSFNEWDAANAELKALGVVP